MEKNIIKVVFYQGEGQALFFLQGPFLCLAETYLGIIGRILLIHIRLPP